MPVRVEVRNGIAVVTLDAPPVNAIGREERQGLLDAIAAVAGDASVVAAVLTGAGGTFAAGANASEFDLPPQPPHLPQAVDAIESSAKPWVAAIQGPALGGGYELALACRRRIAGGRAVVGLPEVTLGVVPGAGGTQRLPRLLGLGPALALIAEGRTVKAEEALRLGLIDEIADDPLATGLETARRLAGAPPAPLSARPRPVRDADAVAAVRATVAKRLRGQQAPLEAIRLVETAAGTDYAEGAAEERATFLRLRESAEAKALRHIFFAERAARRRPELVGGTPRAIGSAVVVGGGTMGAGIAYALEGAGIAVTLVEADDPTLQRARANVARLFDGAVARGLVSPAEAAQRQSAIEWRTSPDGVVADLAIEAVVEDMAVKQAVFRRLDAALKPGAILATNTSYLDVDAIAAVTGRPQDVLGLHFFSPAHIMRLLEVVRAEQTSPDTLATGLALAARLGKIPVVAGVCDGFIGNRILARYREVCDLMLLEGALPWEIDAAMVDFGFAMGVYATQDLSGLDIAYANRRRLDASRDPRRRYVAIADRLVEAGRLGRKAGAGWYRYSESAQAGGEPDPAVEAVVLAEAANAGVTRRHVSADEIRARALAMMVNEAAEILRERIACGPSDIDLVEVFGYGFPRWRGGLLWHADAVGLPAILADVARFAAEDPLVWQPSPLLRDLVRRDCGFAALERV